MNYLLDLSAAFMPQNIQIIGEELAILWEEGHESFIPFERLRACSPSAENVGEKDIFGNQYGGNGPCTFPGVTLVDWYYVGNYAVRFVFSDGHATGIYSWEYLRSIT